MTGNMEGMVLSKTEYNALLMGACKYDLMKTVVKKCESNYVNKDLLEAIIGDIGEDKNGTEETQA